MGKWHMWLLTSEMGWKVAFFFKWVSLASLSLIKKNHNQGIVPTEIPSLSFVLDTNPCDYKYPNGRPIEVLHFWKFWSVSRVLFYCLPYVETLHPPRAFSSPQVPHPPQKIYPAWVTFYTTHKPYLLGIP